MTVEQIKDTVKMHNILHKYAIKCNKGGFICCPFHKEKTASMKIYDSSYHCFGCGEHGDVIDFVKKYEQITFKEAFEKLGGNTKPLTFKKTLNFYNERKKEEKQKREEEKRKKECEKIKDEAECLFYRYLETKAGSPERAEILAKLWALYYRFMSFLETQTINYDISEDFDLWLAWIS